MKKTMLTVAVAMFGAIFMLTGCNSSGGAKNLTAQNGVIQIPLADISDGAAHHFKAKAANGMEVTFFTLKSNDGVIRAAIDACDVCYKAGLGYHQEGEYVVCDNCGQKFHSSKINEIKGGCNPAPLTRKIVGNNLVITLNDITANSWYMQYRKV